MFKRILVANRGEIALRIIRACRELGVETVAIFSEADRGSAYLELADEAYCVGPAKAAESYLKIDRVISAAEIGNVQAIHPGYGFLAENAHFADVCRSCRIEFIGPTHEAMGLVGDKNAARRLAAEVGVPTVPGSEGLVSNVDEALGIAHEIGFPVLIKASAGGGGRGMRVAHNDISLKKGYHTARTEAELAFDNPGVYIEKYFENPRHVEFQILGDAKGNVVHLGERDCSIQRRHQKLVEETPSPAISNRYKDLRKKMGRAAVKVAEAAGYTNAGTVEFIVDESGKFYFLEMNKRIQVEHPITEEAVGVDLIREQIRLAMGEPLKLSQSSLQLKRHAIECRINAEDPFRDFRPSPGLIEAYYPPGGPGVRLDSHVYAGYEIPSLYDSLIGKLIVVGETREEAIARMRRALAEFMIEGVKTTLPLLQRIMDDPDFLRGEYSTSFIERLLAHSGKE